MRSILIGIVLIILKIPVFAQNAQPNLLPIAKAGDDAIVILPSFLSLNGSSSSDPDGSITSYRWTKIRGPLSFKISDSTAISPTVQNLSAGIYSFSLTVRDNQNGISRDTMTATVLAPTPVGNERRILIDAGPVASAGGIVTASPDVNGNFWNNMTDGRAGDRVVNAITTTNLPTTISLEVINRIDGTYNTFGTGMNNVNNVGAVGIYPASATNDYAFSHNSVTNGRWRIKGLDPTRLYTIKFWGTKSFETRDRDIEIKQSDESVWKTYSAASNINFNNAAFFSISGKSVVDFEIRTKANSIFGYINVIDISYNVAPSNQPPTANAGADVIQNLPLDSAILSGCSSSDPENAGLKYKWRKISGGNITFSSDSICNPLVKNLTAGVYNFELVVTDTGNISRADTMALTVRSFSLNWPVLPPAICPQPFKIVTLGSSTTFGTGASPIDSSWVNKVRTYLKQRNAQIEIINLGLGGLNSYQVCPSDFIPPANRPLPDTARNINAAIALRPDAIIISLPTNDAASAFTLQETKDNLDRIAALADLNNIPVWVTTSQPRNNLSLSQVSLLTGLRDWVNVRFGNKAVDYWTELANTDGTINPVYSAGDGIHLNNFGHHVLFTRMLQEKIWDTICLRRNVFNQTPVSSAGNDLNITLPNNITTLTGSASTDADGNIVTYNWRKYSGPTGDNIISPNAIQTAVNFVNAGTYGFELTVTDDDGASSKDSVLVLVNPPLNIAPIARAGNDSIITFPVNSALLSGSASTDTDGNIVSYGWRKYSGPSGETIVSPNTVQTTVNFVNAGTYGFELTVTDNSGASSVDSILVSVNPAKNIPPVARAGNDITILLPNNATTISGSTSIDADGNIVTYSWRKYSGPSGETIVSTNSVQTSISFVNAGTYGFELSVTDNAGATTKDSVLVIVNPNTPPVAKAGADKIIQLPVNKIFLDGRLSFDTTGSIVAYQWSFISGPSGSTLQNTTRDTTSINFVNSGIYIFRLTVTDNGNLSSSDDVQVTVLALSTGSKIINVNIFNGTTPFNNTQWNNWFPSNNVNSSNFKYSDGVVSMVNANISIMSGITDNGAGYSRPAVICPSEVLRFNSLYNTNRTLTINGMIPGKVYNVQLYASRGSATNSRTVFRVGVIADTINTDLNENDHANLNALIASATGQILINISTIGQFNYLAGFKITEVASARMMQPVTQTNTENVAVEIYPNPFSNQLTLTLKNIKEKNTITITNIYGRIIRMQHVFPHGNNIVRIQTSDLPKGQYFITVMNSKNKSVNKMMKL